MNEEDGHRLTISKQDISECLRELQSSYDIFGLKDIDMFEIITEIDTA